MEQLEASMCQGLEQQIPSFNLPSKILCKVVNVHLRAEPQYFKPEKALSPSFSLIIPHSLPNHNPHGVLHPLTYPVSIVKLKPFKPSTLSLLVASFSVTPSIPRDPSSWLALSGHRFLSTARRQSQWPKKAVNIGTHARQLQTWRLWTYVLTFSCVVGFVVIVLNNFRDQLVFYMTPTDALEKYRNNPSDAKLRLGGLVVEGSMVYPSSSPDVELVIQGSPIVVFLRSSSHSAHTIRVYVSSNL